MRPPSYYTSLANSNTASNRNSSQQLRSSFSTSSSSAYATRTHLPFVAQSTLVAHCFTGAGSSTKPYGQPARSYSPSPSYTTSYSRPRSTKRYQPTPYLSTSSSTYTPLPRPSYLPSSSISRTTTSSYRPSASTYYKPIRLRERPLLTQISRQLNATNINTTTATSPSSRLHSVRREEHLSASAANANSTDNEKAQTNDTATAAAVAAAAEESWSSDVARNISRNKYLIKFREFDKRPSIPQLTNQVEDERPPVELATSSSVVPSVQPVKPPEPPQPKAEPQPALQPELKAKRELEKPVALIATTTVAEVAPKRTTEKVTAKRVEAAAATTLAEPKLCQPEDCDKSKQVGAVNEKKKVPKEKRNIKLKVKALNSNSGGAPTGTAEAAPATTKQGKKTPPEAQQPSDGQTAKPKVKRLVKLGKSKTSEPESAETKIVDGESPKELKLEQAKTGSGQAATKQAEGKLPASKPKKKQIVMGPEKEKKLEVPQEEKPKSNEISVGVDSAKKRIRFREYHLDDFNFLSVLGHGGWGFVILAELKEHEAYFAVKCIKKITIVEDDDFDSIMIERKMLTLGNVHPFICKLFCTFETDGYLFFVMEFCPGGDLMFHVQKEGKFTESRCRFYAAEIICAIRFLHNKHIIYRDLKLDNILLDSRGHVRLVDFGMCQCRTYREEMLPSNFCGTPEYISPEIIKGVPYNHSVDWWSFGVLLYEMAVGKMPFRGNDENELLWNVCYEQIHYPMFLTKELTSLLQSLLEREPAKRMGMATCKAGDIYDQPWFRGVDWPAIEAMRVPPPFVPEVSSKRDVRNFDTDFTESAPELSPVDADTLKRIDQKQFQAFPYTNPNIFIFD